MKERPILFSAPMVRALLAGTKTQTRRIVKPRKDLSFGCLLTPSELAGEVNNGNFENCPYGEPGDRLWVRETGWERPDLTTRMIREGADTWPRFAYDADGWGADDHADFKRWGFKRRPSIHMPRWASRILLEITGVRVERLQDISDDDLAAEGIQEVIDAGVDHDGWPRDAYRSLWESINGAGSWAANPWVWCVEFRRVPK